MPLFNVLKPFRGFARDRRGVEDIRAYDLQGNDAYYPPRRNVLTKRTKGYLKGGPVIPGPASHRRSLLEDEYLEEDEESPERHQDPEDSRRIYDYGDNPERPSLVDLSHQYPYVPDPGRRFEPERYPPYPDSQSHHPPGMHHLRPPESLHPHPPGSLHPHPPGSLHPYPPESLHPHPPGSLHPNLEPVYPMHDGHSRRPSDGFAPPGQRHEPLSRWREHFSDDSSEPSDHEYGHVPTQRIRHENGASARASGSRGHQHSHPGDIGQRSLSNADSGGEINDPIAYDKRRQSYRVLRSQPIKDPNLAHRHHDTAPIPGPSTLPVHSKSLRTDRTPSSADYGAPLPSEGRLSTTGRRDARYSDRFPEHDHGHLLDPADPEMHRPNTNYPGVHGHANVAPPPSPPSIFGYGSAYQPSERYFDQKSQHSDRIGRRGDHQDRNKDHERRHGRPRRDHNDEIVQKTIDGYTYYIIPDGRDVIFQDENGNEITRVGNFGERKQSYESRRHNPIVVQDEHGRELYRSSNSHRDKEMHRPSHSNSPPVVVLDHHGRELPLSLERSGHSSDGSYVLLDHNGNQVLTTGAREIKPSGSGYHPSHRSRRRGRRSPPEMAQNVRIRY